MLSCLPVQPDGQSQKLFHSGCLQRRRCHACYCSSPTIRELWRRCRCRLRVLLLLLDTGIAWRGLLLGARTLAG